MGPTALNKRGNKVKLDGYTFDSSKEAYFYTAFVKPSGYDFEVQSNFVETDDRDVLLKVLGNLKDDNIKVQTDDGTTQQVTVKTGVASLSGAVVPNPVALKPYRTFIEVDQPESNFVFRMQSGMRTALFLADGNGWKIEAIQNIKKYLTDHIKNEKVHVIG